LGALAVTAAAAAIAVGALYPWFPRPVEKPPDELYFVMTTCNQRLAVGYAGALLENGDARGVADSSTRSWRNATRRRCA
jgi:hypothetical protein